MKHFKWVAFFLVALFIVLWFIFHPKPSSSHADEKVYETNDLLGSDVVLIALETPPERANLPSTEVLLDKIIKCESSGVATSTNPSSSAKGVAQFIDSTWKKYGEELWGDHLDRRDVFNPKDSRELARYVLTKYGTNDWLESKSCWNH